MHPNHLELDDIFVQADMPAALAPGHLLSAAAPPQAALHAPAHHQTMVSNSTNQATTNWNINLHPAPVFTTELAREG